MKMTFVFSLLD